MLENINTKILASRQETEKRMEFYELYSKCPIPKNEILTNLGLFLNRQTLSRMLFINKIYKKIINTHGIVIEFGSRWGQNLALFSSFRGIYEPFNLNRKIVGFDTFSCFARVSAEDGTDSVAKLGAYNVTDNYEIYLESILEYHNFESPINHLKKYELVKGDVNVTLDKYLEQNPETIISLAYFDLDLYEPTKTCLTKILKHITKGSIIAFDELNCRHFPGETIALSETLGLSKYKIKRTTLSPFQSYIKIK